MPQEQLEILKMVAEKVITPEEGERLLRALNEGSSESEGGPGPFGRGRRRGKGLGDSIADMVNEFGSMMQETFDQTLGDGLDMLETDDPDLPEAPLESGGIALPQGTALAVKHRPRMASLGHKRCDITLEGVSGDRLQTQGPKEAEPRVYFKGERAAVAFGRGPIQVSVPSTVTALRAFSAGGEIRARSLGCPAELKTMGGEIHLEKVVHPVKAKTMGGGVQLEILPGLTGESKVVTLGGDVELRVAEGLAVMVQAVTMGGDIDADPALGASRREGGPLRKAVYVIGAGAKQETDSLPTVRLKTTGGNIRLRKA
ncbi:MAG: hypothetical protein QM765_31290 [Myxococcales bacterium]